MPKAIVAIAAWCISQLFLQGCTSAFIPQRIDLLYSACTSGYTGKGIVEIEKPVASLSGKDGATVVGYVRNGYMHHTADVITQDDVGDWIVLALSKELRAAGFDVRPVRKLTESNLGVRVKIDSVLADIESWRLVARVAYSMTILDGDALRQTFAIKGEGTYLSTYSSPESYARSLELALQNTMKDAVPKIVIEASGGAR